MTKAMLQDITTQITDGKHGDCINEQNSGFYFVSCKDVYDGRIHYEQSRQITEDDCNAVRKRIALEPGDSVITNSGTIGRMALATECAETYRTAFQKSVAVVKPDRHKVIPEYLYYLLLSCVEDMARNSNGSAQKNLLLSTMREFELDYLESFEEQQRVIEVLSAYDNLIENNRRQIALLEEAAQRLYREWFVDLRFPGHENVEIVDGVPQGWAKVKLGDLVPVRTGKKDANYGTIDGRFPFFTCAQEPIQSPDYSFDAAAILLAGNGDFYTKLYRGKFEAYQRTYVLIPKNDDDLFISFFALRGALELLGVGASGSTIKYLTKRMIEEVPVIVPNRTIQSAFNCMQAELLRKTELLKRMVADAREARNRLLPKLMSGEIEV